MSKIVEQQVRDLEARVATLERLVKDLEGRRLADIADTAHTLKLKRG